MKTACIMVVEIFWFFAMLQIIRDILVVNHGVAKYCNYKKIYKVTQKIYVPDLYIMLPALNEYKGLIDTIEWIRSIPYSGKKKIYVITSDKEERNVQKTTMDYVEEYITNIATQEIIHIHYPKKSGNKASQLNYTLQLEKDKLLNNNSYVAIYDADSKPSRNTFYEFINLINEVKTETKKLPIVVQQPSLFLKNYDKIPWTMQLEAISMTRRVFGIEIANMIKTQNQNRRIPVYSYCVGHGMFVKTSFLYENGLFPEPHEDVPFGQMMCIRNIPIYTLWELDDCEVAKSIRELVRQSGRWFLNSLLVWKIVKQEWKNPLSLKFRTVCMGVKGLNDTFTWTHYAIGLFTTCLLVLFKILPIYSLGILILLWYLDVGIGSIIVLRNVIKKREKIGFLTEFFYFIMSPMREFVRFIGVIKGITYLIKGARAGIENIMPKAER